MDRRAIQAWAVQAQSATQLLYGAIQTFGYESVIDDIAVMGHLGNQLIALSDLTASSVPEPTDDVQRVHWRQLLALCHAFGFAVNRAATTELDLTGAGELSRQIAEEIQRCPIGWPRRTLVRCN